ncbi:MAG: polysaccharide biosynthesis protein [Clostridia bacterium]|nr:polysaccharide biosynthesis protein [Clostridia bacterium]
MEKTVTVLLPFICRTIFIKVLGSEYLGLNSLFSSILQVLSISELGIGTAIVFSMYRPIAEDNEELLCALLNVYRKVYKVIGTIILAVGLAILPILPKLIKGTYPDDVNIYILYLIFLFNTVIGYYLFAYKQALFSAYQRNDLLSKRATIINIVSNLLQIVLLIVTRNYYVYILVSPIATIANNIINAYLANKMYPNIHCRGSITSEMKKSIKKRIVGLLSFKIYNVVFASVDTIVISSFLGLTPLAKYNNYYYIQTSIIGFLAILTASITAGVGNKMITDSVDDNYRDFKNFTFANGWLTSWCTVCLLCLYQHFIKSWVGESYLFPFSTMYLMVLYFFLPRLTTMTYTYREAAGLWWEDRFRPLVATGVNLVVNIILVQIIGMNGVIISTLICTIFINVPWGSYILFKNYFKRSVKEYFGQLFYYLIVTNIAGFITLYICNLLPEEGWIYLFVKALICCFVPNIIFFVFYRKMEEFKYAKILAERVFNKIKRKV